MVNKAIKAIKQFNMLNEKDNVIVALSGGADSMALFCFMLDIASEYNINVMAAHVEHGIRGETSLDDAKFVEDFCARKGVKLFKYSADMSGREKPKGMSTEQWARELRYNFFDKLIIENNAKIATAHTASDNAETLLFRIARGSDIKGMAGIPPVRGDYIRPLIFATRSDVEDYCRANNIDYVTDETNLELIYSRNIIRLSAIPALEKTNELAQENIAAFSQKMLAMQEYFDSEVLKIINEAKNDIGYDIEKLKSLHTVLKGQVVAKILSEFCEISDKKVKLAIEVLDGDLGAVEISKNIKVRCKNKNFIIEKYSNNTKKEYFEMSFKEGKTTLWNGENYNIEIINYEEYKKNCKINKKYLNNLADCDKIQSNKIFRTRMAKDKFYQRGRKIGKTLKKLFMEDNIPKAERGVLPLLATDNEILWIDGYGFCDRLCPDENTKRVLLINKNNKL